MDKLLLNSLIDIVINDNETKNTYENFDKLLLTFSDDEIIYFIEGCKEYTFKNLNLFNILIEHVPHIFMDYLNNFIDDKLAEIEKSQFIINEEYKMGLIKKEDYLSIIESYNSVIDQFTNLKLTYIFQILSNLKK